MAREVIRRAVCHAWTACELGTILVPLHAESDEIIAAALQEFPDYDDHICVVLDDSILFANPDDIDSYVVGEILDR